MIDFRRLLSPLPPCTYFCSHVCMKSLVGTCYNSTTKIYGKFDCGVEIFEVHVTTCASCLLGCLLIMSDEKNEDTAVSKQGVRSSLIKNKLRRQIFYQKERLRKAKEKREKKESRKRQAEEQVELGEDVSSIIVIMCYLVTSILPDFESTDFKLLIDSIFYIIYDCVYIMY